MAIVEPNSFSLPTVEGSNRLNLFKKLSRATGILKYGTVTSGARDYIIDSTRLKSSQLSHSEWEGGWVRISSTTDSLAPQGEIIPISIFTPELGKVEGSPYFTVAPESGDTYELWKLDPQDIIDIVDEALTDDLYVPCWTVLSEVPDYDMEQSGTTDWTAVNSTVTKQTSEPRSPWSGKRYLRVVSSSAGGYARTALLNVQGGKPYFSSAAARASIGTAKLVIYDETNGAIIDSWTSDQMYPNRISLFWQSPTTCKQVSLRLTSVDSGDTTEWDEVIFHSTYSPDIELPWWIKNRNQVKGIFQYQPITITDKIWDMVLKGEYDSRFDIYDMGQKKRAVARQGVITWPLYLLGIRNETAYSDDTTDLKYIDPNLFIACLGWKIYKYLCQPFVNGILDVSNSKLQLASYLKDYTDLSYQQSETLNLTIKSPTPMGRFLDSRFRYGA